jgi:hypothetical protein
MRHLFGNWDNKQVGTSGRQADQRTARTLVGRPNSVVGKFTPTGLSRNHVDEKSGRFVIGQATSYSIRLGEGLKAAKSAGPKIGEH